MEPTNMTTALALAALGGAAAVWLWTAFFARRRRLREEAAARARLDSAPLGLWRRADDAGEWRLSAPAAALLRLEPSIDPSPAVVLEALQPSHRDPAAQALDSLIGAGTPFDMTVERADGGATLELRGRRVGADALIWIADVSDAAMLAESYAERDLALSQQRALIDSLPTPVWWRREDLSLEGVNAAYAETVERDAQAALAEQLELGGERGRELAERARRTGVAQAESHYVVVGGERRLFDLNEVPAPDAPDRLVGFARDMSALEALYEKLGDHIAAHAEVLERLEAAIAIYAADRRMTFYNTAFRRLWDLPADRLEDGLTLGEVLELMRERRAIPEIIDFPGFKRQQDRLFTSLIEPQEELLHLPDERTVRVTVSPHPQGGLIFVYEDVSDRLALERSHNTLTAVQRMTLDSLYEGVAVFGSDARIRLWNDGFVKLFGLDPDALERFPHIAEIAESGRSALPRVADWERFKAQAVLAVSEPRARSGRMDLQTGRTVDYAYVPLPNAQCLLLYLDVTDTVRVERALKERNAALEKADLLKSQFISSISYELRSPLNAILGFTEMLGAEMFGPLNPRQREQVSDIHAASRTLAALIDDVLDLAALQAGYLAIERKPVRLRALIEEVRTAAEEEAARRGVTLRVETSERLGLLEADGRRLRQTIVRVVSTALSYAGEAAPVSLRAERADDRFLITVTDPGHGLLAMQDSGGVGADLNAASGQLTGAGVGLALCKNLMELHGGRLRGEAASAGRPGRIVMELPVAASEDEAGPASGAASESASASGTPSGAERAE
eukprot:g14123.t1